MSFYSSLIRRVCDSAVQDFTGALESFGFRGSSFRGLYTGFLSIDCRQDSSIWSLVVSLKEADSTVLVSLSRESSPSGLDVTLGEWRHPADDSAWELEAPLTVEAALDYLSGEFSEEELTEDSSTVFYAERSFNALPLPAGSQVLISLSGA